MINEAADRVPAVVTRTGRQRQFSEEDKQRIVEETCRPGQSLSAAARRYGIDLRLLVRWRRALGVGGSAAPTSLGQAHSVFTVRIQRRTLLHQGERPLDRSTSNDRGHG